MSSRDLSNETFLLTGAYGFIGAWIVKRLIDEKARVIIFDIDDRADRLRLIMNDDEIAHTTLVKGDITDEKSIMRAVDQFAVSRLIHLAGLQVPICKADPRRGAMVNVLGTINVFEAARQAKVENVVYASSAAVFGLTENDHAVTELDNPQPSSHYGVFKRCNEGNAHVYFLDHGVNSVGLRPLTVYGVGRDFGLTSDPTKAMKAAVVGRPFHIRFGGRTDFQYVADTAEAFIRASTSNLEGAHVFNLHGETVHLTQIVSEIEQVRPEARGTITHADEPLAIPAEFDDSAIRSALGDMPVTSLTTGVSETINRFSELQRNGRLDVCDLEQ
jgi:nucleoside-diphosphate-sugar epimerase